jgi:hypothetical protein
MITALQVAGPEAADHLRTLLSDLAARPPRVILVLFDIPDPPAEWALS